MAAKGTAELWLLGPVSPQWVDFVEKGLDGPKPGSFSPQLNMEAKLVASGD
jgi:hypothetical protein